jgi:hypothetical protein
MLGYRVLERLLLLLHLHLLACVLAMGGVLLARTVIIFRVVIIGTPTVAAH